MTKVTTADSMSPARQKNVSTACSALYLASRVVGRKRARRPVFWGGEAVVVAVGVYQGGGQRQQPDQQQIGLAQDDLNPAAAGERLVRLAPPGSTGRAV